MRYAVLILFYDCDQFILRTIDNCAPHVEKIYVSYSPYPWSYNPEAREKYRNPSSPDLIKNSRHWNKIQLVEGDIVVCQQLSASLQYRFAEFHKHLRVARGDDEFKARRRADRTGNARAAGNAGAINRRNAVNVRSGLIGGCIGVATYRSRFRWQCLRGRSRASS